MSEVPPDDDPTIARLKAALSAECIRFEPSKMINLSTGSWHHKDGVRIEFKDKSAKRWKNFGTVLVPADDETTGELMARLWKMREELCKPTATEEVT